MQYGEVKISQGKSYPFVVLGLKDIPGFGEQFILQMELGNGPKFMLDARDFRHYELSQGKHIECRVDKVNCDGKVFLEPKHPYYTEGEVYEFDVVSSANATDEFGQQYFSFELRDYLGQPQEVAITGEQFQGELPSKISCRVENVRKGHLWLSQLGLKVFEFRLGEIYPFRVVEKALLDERPALLLEGPLNTQHYLESSFYARYGFNPGDQIRCSVVRIRPDGSPVLEPEHPKYERGLSYEFEFVAYEEQNDESLEDDLEEGSVLLLQDSEGNKARLILFERELPGKLIPGAKVTATVVRYRRGEIILTR
jgi:hypothetical protein